MLNTALLRQGAEQFGLPLTEDMLRQFEEYAARLCAYNEKVNLTAITDPDGIAVKHFVDSIAPLHFYPVPQGARLADVGSGAGFPSVPMAVVRPDLSITQIDSLNKRLVFLSELCAALGIRAQQVHLRGEEAGRKAEHREVYEVVTARAVARLNILCEWCLPLVKPGGVLLALKGPEGTQELKQAHNAVKELGGRALEPVCYTLPDKSARTLVIIKKISQTSTKYPRQTGKITKKPL